MADLDYDHFDGGYEAADSVNRFGRMVNLGGAALSVMLIISGAVWAYQLAMRDVSGIPVIRALGDPLRLAPTNPGGEEALHQGLSVNAVAAAGTALPLPETLMLAPRPTELAAEDIAGLSPLDPVEGVLPLAEPAAEPLIQSDAEPLVDPIAAPALLEAEAIPEVLPETQQDAVALALAEALGLDVPEDQGADLVIEASAQVRPKARPGSAVAALEAVEQVSAPATEIDPATIATGTRLVQLGAFDNQDEAKAEWARLSGQFGDLMAGKALVVQPATSGGRTFYRLRAHGFGDEDEARRFCTAMLAENATCIPVAQR